MFMVQLLNQLIFFLDFVYVGRSTLNTLNYYYENSSSMQHNKSEWKKIMIILIVIEYACTENLMLYDVLCTIHEV